MSKPTNREIAQAIRDINRINHIRHDIKVLESEINDLCKNIAKVSDNISYPCVISANGESFFFSRSLWSWQFTDINQLKIQSYDLGVSNHDNNTRDNTTDV